MIFLVGGVRFAIPTMTYVEGGAMFLERGGSSMFARHAFNELVSFIAGWAICLDYLILIAICAFGTTDYAAVFWGELDSGVPEFLRDHVVPRTDLSSSLAIEQTRALCQRRIEELVKTL